MPYPPPHSAILLFLLTHIPKLPLSLSLDLFLVFTVHQKQQHHQQQQQLLSVPDVARWRWSLSDCGYSDGDPRDIVLLLLLLVAVASLTESCIITGGHGAPMHLLVVVGRSAACG